MRGHRKGRPICLTLHPPIKLPELSMTPLQLITCTLGVGVNTVYFDRIHLTYNFAFEQKRDSSIFSLSQVAHQLSWQFTQLSRERFRLERKGFAPASERRSSRLPRPLRRSQLLSFHLVKMIFPSAVTLAPYGTSLQLVFGMFSISPLSLTKTRGPWTQWPWTPF